MFIQLDCVLMMLNESESFLIRIVIAAISTIRIQNESYADPAGWNRSQDEDALPHFFVFATSAQ